MIARPNIESRYGAYHARHEARAFYVVQALGPRSVLKTYFRRREPVPIETDFGFGHQIYAPAAGALNSRDVVDFRGLLAGFVGNAKMGTSKKSWHGKGFNLIWRPNHGQSGPQDFFLQLNETHEQLDFTDITATGIANRGLLQSDITLGGIAYLQAVKDSFDGTGQHFEPGVWINVPNTTDPEEPSIVSRMGSIPHGSTVNLQGVSFTAPKPVITASSITPFKAKNPDGTDTPDDGKTNLVPFPEEILATVTQSRTALERLPGLTQPLLSNPNKFLTDAIAGQDIISTTVLIIASKPSLLPQAAPPVPAHAEIGGGIRDIAFLDGTADGPNASVTDTTAIFWIETVRDRDGNEYLQLQYTQRVLLEFKGLKWPHVSVATLR